MTAKAQKEEWLCKTCKHSSKACDVKRFMNNWTYSQYDGTNCFQWENWNASDAT